MSMNVRFGRILALLALVGAAIPATAGAAGSGGPILGAASRIDCRSGSMP